MNRNEERKKIYIRKNCKYLLIYYSFLIMKISIINFYSFFKITKYFFLYDVKVIKKTQCWKYKYNFI